MNILATIKHEIIATIKKVFTLDDQRAANVFLVLQLDKEKSFGDLSCNAAMVLAKELGKNPRQLAQELVSAISSPLIKSVEIAGPGFLNISLTHQAWSGIAHELFDEKNGYFCDTQNKKLNYLIEFVSANPTGPLHLGHGRGGIIGDVLARVLMFLGNAVHKEFYINDAGNQIKLLGVSLKVRCKQALGYQEELPENGYAGDYLVDIAKTCIAEFGDTVWQKDDEFFSSYAKEDLLKLAQHDLKNYGIIFDQWFSEKTLHESGVVEQALDLLKDKGLAYESEGALWFKSTEFGDDKDRVVKKSTGELTYIAADIAYHKNKFDRKFDVLIDILGQDHHGYVKRLKATMQALGYNAESLDVILYQLVTIKENDVAVRMSKRAGTFTKLSDVVDAVGCDVARFFYLNRKADAHLEFDLAIAIKKTEENPVYYLQYAYVRTGSVLAKAEQEQELQAFVQKIKQTVSRGVLSDELRLNLDPEDINLLKKIVSLQDILHAIATSYQTHLLAYYSSELAHAFHSYYAKSRIIDLADLETSKKRLVMVVLLRQTMELCLDLLGLSKPEKM
jgi:arginyl-tRNA synthetase